MFVASENVPGYLPQTDEPAVFDTTGQAWAYLAARRIEGEEMCLDTGQEFSDTVSELERLADENAPCGSVHGATPGGGIYDLGITYTVSEVE